MQEKLGCSQIGVEVFTIYSPQVAKMRYNKEKRKE
jgi:hypothetical protein